MQNLHPVLEFDEIALNLAKNGCRNLGQRTSGAAQADENWRKHEEELLEMQHMRATVPACFLRWL